MNGIAETIAKELNKPVNYIQNVIDLYDEGCTIPFIARYRKEAHGAMDDTALRTLEERLKYLRNLADRKEEIKKSIDEQGKLTPDLEKAIEEAKTLSEVEDIYRPYKQKSRLSNESAFYCFLLYYIAFTCFINFDLRLEALFL